MRLFRSDNCAGLCPEARQALLEVDGPGHVVAYGDDEVTQWAVGAIRDLLGPDVYAGFVATGTAANTLAIASLTQPWEQVLCHAHSHYNDDESTAPERLTHCRTTPIMTDSSKLTVEDVEHATRNHRGDVHQTQPGVLTISNPTEFGTVYSPAEVRAICDVAHDRGYRVHVDGARFANAVAALACKPAELTAAAGVDALSFGGTKNGLALGEAVVFFPQGDGRWFERAAEAFPHHRKSTGHLLSKHRYVAGPFAACLTGGVWLGHAGHANGMASALSSGLADLGVRIMFPTEVNGVFAVFPNEVHEALVRAGQAYYAFGDVEWNMTRLMASFDTTPSDVEGFLAVVRRAIR